MTAGSEGSPVFDTTSLDFASVEQDLIRYAQARFSSESWTAFNDSNEGRRLIELMAYATDLLAYTENAHAKETIVASIRREQNFRNVAKTYDFSLDSATPATTTLRFTLNPALLPISIPSTFKVADSSGDIIFQPDVTGTATSSTYEVSATQGDEVVGESLATSDGSPGQRHQLAQTPLIDDTETISVAGVPYTKVVNFIEAGPTDEVYKLETDEDDSTTVIFGDGINGKIPPFGSAITATYKIGGGSEGNLPAGSITRLVSSLSGVLSVTNITDSTEGGPKQSLADARDQLPLEIKANERCVTDEDYATTAVALVPSILKAVAVPGAFQAGGSPVILFVVPNGGGDVSASLANTIVSTLRYGTSSSDPGRAMAGKRIFVRTAKYVYLELSVDAYVQKGSSALATADRVRTALETRYDMDNVDFKESITLQDAYNTVDPVEQEIDGLSRVYIRRFTITPHWSTYVNSPASGNGTVEGITVDGNQQRREWNIEFRIPVGVTPEYIVTQRRLGYITTIVNASIEDESAAYETNELVGDWELHVREQEQDEVFSISGNTSTSITITGTSSPSGVSGLLTLATNGDSYAVEKEETTVGKVARATPTGTNNAGQPVVNLTGAPSAAFTNGVKVLVRQGDNEAVMTVSSTGASSITFTSNLSFAVTGTGTLDWYWESDDGTVGFAVVQGTTSFVPGDQLYVDTYPVTGDIQLRSEEFLLLDEDDLVIRTIGGVQ